MEVLCETFLLNSAVTGYAWTLVDDCYIQGLFSIVQITAWHQFFFKLGVLDFLAVEEKTVSFSVDQIVSKIFFHSKVEKRLVLPVVLSLCQLQKKL